MLVFIHPPSPTAGYEADVHSPGTVMGDSQGICPAEEEMQKGLKHTQAHGEHGGTALTQTHTCISLAFLL